MSRLCERPGCSAPASVAYGFNTQILAVWLNGYDPNEGFGTGILCRRHADALVVPRGWHIDDKRENIPRLFLAPAGEAAHGDTPSRGIRRKAPKVQPQLFAKESQESVDHSPIEDEPLMEETRAIPWSPQLVAEAEVSVLNNDEPKKIPSLLDRAFGNKDRREK
ncbi:MAG: hypothetical protein WCG49_11390 [Actinomycetes bacterium]